MSSLIDSTYININLILVVLKRKFALLNIYSTDTATEFERRGYRA